MVFRTWVFIMIFSGILVLVMEAWKEMFWHSYEFNEMLKKIQKVFLISFIINFFLIVIILVFFVIFFC